VALLTPGPIRVALLTPWAHKGGPTNLRNPTGRPYCVGPSRVDRGDNDLRVRRGSAEEHLFAVRPQIMILKRPWASLALAVPKRSRTLSQVEDQTERAQRPPRVHSGPAPGTGNPTGYDKQLESTR
jgi:hypothetical protein